jgi:hypothetical protein
MEMAPSKKLASSYSVNMEKDKQSSSFRFIWRFQEACVCGTRQWDQTESDRPEEEFYDSSSFPFESLRSLRKLAR